MSKEEKLELAKRLEEGLRLSYERMLHEKMRLNQSVIIADDTGMAKEIPARQAWENYLREQNQDTTLI